MSDFSLSLGNIENKKVFQSQNLKDGMSVDELKDDDAKKIFTSIFDENKDGKLSAEERNKAFENLQAAAKTDGDDTNLSEKEAKTFLEQFNDLKDVTVDKFLNFLNNKKDKEVEETGEAESSQNTQGKEKPEEKELTYSTYTVQNGESFKKLIMKAYGITDPKDPKLKEAIEDFNKNNPGAMKTAKNGVQYLLVGAKVKLPGNLEDKNNSAEQIAEYSKAREAEKTAKTNKPAATGNKGKVKGKTQEKTTATGLKVGDPDPKHKGFFVNNINDDGTFIVKDKNNYKHMLCDKNGNVKEVWEMKNGTMKSTEYENGKATTTWTYEKGERNTASTKVVSRRNHDDGVTVTWKTLNNGKEIAIRKYNNGKEGYNIKNEKGEWIPCDKNGNPVK